MEKDEERLICTKTRNQTQRGTRAQQLPERHGDPQTHQQPQKCISKTDEEETWEAARKKHDETKLVGALKRSC